MRVLEEVADEERVKVVEEEGKLVVVVVVSNQEELREVGETLCINVGIRDPQRQSIYNGAMNQAWHCENSPHRQTQAGAGGDVGRGT